MTEYLTCSYGTPSGVDKQLTMFNYIRSSEEEPVSQEIRRSFLQEGDPSRRKYGDNEVTHWVMKVHYTPKVESTVPELRLQSDYFVENRVIYRTSVYYDGRFYYGRGGINTFDIYYGTTRRFVTSGVDYVSANHIRVVIDKDTFIATSYNGSKYFSGTSDPSVAFTVSAENRWAYTVPSTYGGPVEVIWSKAPSLPYYWKDYMMERINQNSKASDVEALSELIRNVIQEQTTYNTNGYANILSFLDMLKDAKNLAIVDLIEDSKSLWKTIMQAAGKAVEDGLDPNVTKRVARQALRKRSKDEVASAWLQYRYVYNTTKADYEQFVKAQIGEYLGSLDDHRVLRGSIGITDGTLRVKMRLTDNTRPNFEKMLISANQYGMFPGLYTIWDMIPFSFIADWAAPLGDELQDIDQSIFFSYYEINELLVTREIQFQKEEPWGLTEYKYYERRQLDSMPTWEIYEDPKEPGGKTIVKRCLDGISIVSSFI